MIKKIMKVLLILCMFFSFQVIDTKAENEMETRAVWFSYLDFQKYLRDLDEDEFIEAFEEICENAIDQNLNTLIVHVRAFNDAIYPTEKYPWADWLTTRQVDPGYDPLELMIELAHEYGLKFEAWVNPYRISLTTKQSEAFTRSAYMNQYRESDLIPYQSGSDSRIILNPASKKAQRNIVKGIEEIVRNYDVDGIHFDDYFYQTGTEGSTEAWQRRMIVNELIKEVYDSIKAIDEEVVFGISPQGNLDNCRAHGADIDTWLSTEGYVDYLMPQIYWSDQWGADGSTAMFTQRATMFKNIWKNKNIDLKVGLGTYMIDRQPAGDIGWMEKNDNLASQVKKAAKLGYNGYSLYRYDDLTKEIAQPELNHLKKLFDKNEEVDKEEPETPENPEGKNGWEKQDGKWYFFRNDEVVKGWLKDQNCWYMLDYNDGSMQSGWIAGDETHWYYMNPENGIMQTGKRTIDGITYLFENSGEFAGSMLRNGTYTINNDTCTLNPDGSATFCQ